MFIGCTKKLQQELGVTLQKKGYEEKELFSWSANLIKVNRRKTVVVVNDNNRFGFVLYGLKAKEFKKIDELILQGIRRCLEEERIRKEIIDQYLNDAGTIVFGNTRGPKYVSRMNKACEIVGFMEDLLDLENMYQFKITRRLNNDYIKINKNDYKHPFILLLKDLRETYGESIVKCEAVNILVKMDLDVYTAERSIITPIDISFEELHDILQVAFDWRDYHLHEFDVINEKGEKILIITSEYDDDFYPIDECKVVIDSKTCIQDYMKEKYTIIYKYDFGDGWEHEIKVNSIISDYDKNHPICIEGTGDAPPEDVGGVPGYKEFLEIMADPKHLEYKSTKSWASGQWYSEFDIEMINRRLTYVLKK